MTAAAPDPLTAPEPVHTALTSWYHRAARDLPWRRRDCSAWGVLVSEAMLQQTPVSRVVPRWHEWMRRWPTPQHAAEAPVAEILTVWDRLGYPRRALRLQESAQVIVDRHGGQVPQTAAELRQLPGVGEYTAAAVACFAFDQPEVVVDTNIRRVHARVFAGDALPGKTYTSDQRRLAHSVFPDPAVDDGELACTWNIAVMELGALVCTARSPSCTACPVAEFCAWRLAGSPPPTEQQRTRAQTWAGTDRQVRGAIMAALRTGGPAARSDLLAELPLPAVDMVQRSRCMESLIADGLAEQRQDKVALPGALA
ncbi:A/G-specific adenine glycosylase [Nesterenkonia sphaerica]|uniref:Adenine DNA glycosylase n=1 Tax=Nesterenkonia sphaerica TaxID=1804988 RepID=A0A5R9ANQ1_9MICC|nr:A/G-specific adenine glycosylase [Nesterenkonia sphaerica]TLP80069.1 A/G-specific adenine glycosylase [Nesterenkonia sphaerica]